MKKEIFKKPETIPIWQKLEKIEIKNKKECLDAFIKIVKEVERGKHKFVESVTDGGPYYIVSESNRQGSNFIHVVPKEAYKIFEEMRMMMPNSFLGFSMLCGKIGSKDLRVSCFAIPTSEITKVLISGRRK